MLSYSMEFIEYLFTLTGSGEQINGPGQKKCRRRGVCTENDRFPGLYYSFSSSVTAESGAFFWTEAMPFWQAFMVV
jgi:hypothetical protein